MGETKRVRTQHKHKILSKLKNRFQDRENFSTNYSIRLEFAQSFNKTLFFSASNQNIFAKVTIMLKRFLNEIENIFLKQKKNVLLNFLLFLIIKSRLKIFFNYL